MHVIDFIFTFKESRLFRYPRGISRSLPGRNYVVRSTVVFVLNRNLTTRFPAGPIYWTKPSKSRNCRNGDTCKKVIIPWPYYLCLLPSYVKSIKKNSARRFKIQLKLLKTFVFILLQPSKEIDQTSVDCSRMLTIHQNRPIYCDCSRTTLFKVWNGLTRNLLF